MNKCRVCLGEKRNLHSIFDTENGESFASMMMSLANIKIVGNEGITEEICKRCSQKLIEGYNFKVQIESSDEVLRKSAGLKRIWFSNLQDKMKIEIDTTREITEQSQSEISDSLKEGTLVYNDTTIKKIDYDTCSKKNDNEPLTVTDFFTNFTPDENFDFDDVNDYNYVGYVAQSDVQDYGAQSDDDDDDPEYRLPLTKKSKPDLLIVPLSERKLKANKRKKKINVHSAENVLKQTNRKATKTLIKPILLRDVRVLPTMPTIKEKTVPNTQKLQMCYCCGKMVKSLKIHLLTHKDDKTYKCDICPKSFVTKKRLMIHRETHNKRPRSYKCDKCVGTFVTATALQSHYITHMDEKQFVCEFCSKSFKRKGALRRHKLIHSGAKPIKCDQCKMSFLTKYNLRHHLRVHTGERPFKCEICSQPYSYKHDFNRHCFNKHGIFLKRRNVYVMNEEVLKREKALMRDLMLKVQGMGKAGEPLNPFEGPQAALAFEQAIKALKENSSQINILFKN